jgi:hypothetical protein
VDEPWDRKVNTAYDNERPDPEWLKRLVVLRLKDRLDGAGGRMVFRLSHFNRLCDRLSRYV